MDRVGELDLLRRALTIVAGNETILEPVAFEAFAGVVAAPLGIRHMMITRADRRGFFRVLALTRGAMDALLPFRQRLASSEEVYETVYARGEPYRATHLASGFAIEQKSATLGVGSYFLVPVRGARSGSVIAALGAVFGDGASDAGCAETLLTELSLAIGASVERGLSMREHERASRILEATGDAMLAWDAEGRLVDLNRAAETLVGASREDLLGTSLLDLFGAVPIGPSSGKRLALRARDGRRLVVAATISTVQSDPLVYAHALLRDLSDVIAAESDASARLSQLRELTEQHMVLLDNAPLLIFRLDPQTGEVLYLNRHAERLFGVPASKALSTPDFLRDAHVDPEGATAFEEAVVVARLGQVMAPYEARLKREGGDSIIARGTIYPILAESGRVSGIEGILLDVTGERAARSRLLQADRLATVGMLAAGVAHEINNPAAFMLLGLDVLGRTVLGPNVKMTPDADAQARQLISDLKETGRRIVEIAHDMRTFASPPGQGRRTLVDVSRTIESALTITRAQIVEKAEIEVCVSPELPLVAVEDGRLGQVLVNLLVNAAQAISAARASRGVPPDGDRVRIRASSSGSHVEIAVEDSGLGMRQDVIDRAFTPFFTTRQPEGGTGLGLAISKTIIEAAGGTITASSPSTLGDPPTGSRFEISLPAFMDVMEAAPDSSMPAEVTPPHARVLIVEDEVLLGRALADQLSDPHEVKVVVGGEEALAVLAKERFDVVLCDVKMPTMGGEDLYRRVADLDREQARRFVFMTGIGFDPEFEKFLAQVGAPLLEKPFPIRKAQRIIGELVGLRGQLGAETK